MPFYKPNSLHHQAMRIFVNDQPRDLAEGAAPTVAAVMAESGLPSFDGVAVAVNESVVARARWADHRLAAGDKLLVIRATQGG